MDTQLTEVQAAHVDTQTEAKETPTETSIEEKPVEEKPAEEKPAEEKPAEEKPAAEKPAGEKSAEENLAEEKPAEEKPAEEKPASEEKPAEEEPSTKKPLSPKEILAGLKGPKKPTEMAPELPPELPAKPENPLVAPVLQTPTAYELSNIRKFRLDEVTAAEWDKIMENNHILYGYCPYNGPYLTPKGLLASAPQPAFQAPQGANIKWPFPENADRVQLVVTETSSTTETTIVAQGFSSLDIESKLGASLETFSVAVQADMTTQKSSSKSSAQKTESHSIVGEFCVPYANVNLDISKLVLTNACKSYVEKIMSGKNIRDVIEFFNQFGRIFPQQVSLGGHLHTSATIQSSQSAEKQSQLDKFASSLQASIDVPLIAKGSLSVTGEVQDRKAQSSSSSSSTKSLAWNGWGGDDMVITDVNGWRQSLRFVHNWRVVEFGNLGKLELIIGRLDEYRNFPQIVEDILRLVNAPITRSIPLLAYQTQETQIHQPLVGGPIALFKGVDSHTAELKPSPFEAFNHTHELDYPFPPEHDWRILSDGTSLAGAFGDFQDLHSHLFNLASAPTYLSHVHTSSEMSQFGISVILRWQSGGFRYYLPEPEKVSLTAEPEKVSLTAEASKVLKKQDGSFLQTYGDNFVVNIERRTCVTAVWRISFGGFKEDLESFNKALTEKFATKQGPQEGADIIKKLLEDTPNPERREAKAFMYFSSLGSGAMELDITTSSMSEASEQLAMHLAKKAAVVTRLQVFPYQYALPAIQRIAPLDQDGFDSWTDALQKVYYAMNESRKLPKTSLERDGWDKQLRENEKKLIASQKDILSGRKDTLLLVSEDVKELQGKIKERVQNARNVLEPLQLALEDWVVKSRQTEIDSVTRLPKTKIFHEVKLPGMERYPYWHRACKEKSRKFGLSDPPSNVDETSRQKLAKLVKQVNAGPWEYYLGYFDGMTTRFFTWDVEPPVAGYRLLAYEIVNEWKDSSDGTFWLDQPYQPFEVGKGAPDDDEFWNQTNVGKAEKLSIYFERPPLKSYKVKATTWWIPTKITEAML